MACISFDVSLQKDDSPKPAHMEVKWCNYVVVIELTERLQKPYPYTSLDAGGVFGMLSVVAYHAYAVHLPFHTDPLKTCFNCCLHLFYLSADYR